MVLSIQDLPDYGKGEFPSTNNQLLCLLSKSELQNILSNSNGAFIPAKTTLHQPDEPIEKVYFPIRGIISLVNTSEEGFICQIAMVSNEGMVGITAFLGGNCFPSFAIAQTDCIAISFPSNIIKQEFSGGGNLQRILLLYTQALFTQISQNVFCSSHHTIQQRLARCLLAFSDRLLTKELLLTQETLADLLGVRRSSLSVIANKLRQRSIIDYSRGRIIIQNSVALRKIACNCNLIISEEYSRLLNSLKR